jgi:hypothetical protein
MATKKTTVRMAKTTKTTKSVPASQRPTKTKIATAKAVKAQKEKQVSCIDAAAQILAASKTPMNTTELIEAMAAKGLWTSPGGQTPQATLYSAILREINAKGKDARFKKTDRGRFAANK